MKFLFLFSTLIFLSCTAPKPGAPEKPVPSALPAKAPAGGETGILTYCWRGNLDGNIPVQLQCQVEGNIVTGRILRLSVMKPLFTNLIGTVENKEFRLLEFVSDGNIVSVISGKREGTLLVGNCTSTQTQQERNMKLSQVDTTLPVTTIAARPTEVGGSYSYNYSQEGPQGTLTLKPLAGGKALLEISAVTSAPGRNIADVGPDTVEIENGNRVIYRFPDAPECSFQVRFYRNFAVVNYLQEGGCTGQFGHNATVEGIFLKTGK